MSGILSGLLSLFGAKNRKKKVKIVCCGLDNSGKTTIINLLKPKKQQTLDVTPTVGFSVEEFEKDNLSFTVFDMSGQGKFRNLWENFYPEVDGVVFVIDASDRVRMSIAKSELDLLLAHKGIRTNVPLLFFANKQDLPHALSAQECSEVMELDQIRERSWNICATNALKGVGVDTGVKWLGMEVAKVAT